MAVLETLVRQLAAGGVARQPVPPPARPVSPPVSAPVPPPAAASPAAPAAPAVASVSGDTAAAAGLATTSPRARATARRGPRAAAVDSRIRRPLHLQDPSARLRALGGAAPVSRHRRRRAAARGGLSAQALVRPQLDLTDAALLRRRRRGGSGRRPRLAAGATLPHLRRGADRGRSGDHLPEHLGGVAALRCAPVRPRHRGSCPGLRGAGDDRLCDRRRSARRHRRAGRVLRSRAAGSEPQQRRSAPVVPGEHGRGPRAWCRPAGVGGLPPW